MATITPGAKLLIHLHHAEIKRPMAYYVLHVGDHETHSQQYDKETHPIFDSKLEFDLTGWWKPKPVAFELFKENRILKDSVCGAFHTTVADLLYIAGLSDDVGPSGIPKIKVTRTPDQPPNIKFWLDVGTGENDSETYTGRVCLSLEIVNTKYIYTPDEECLDAIKLQGPAKMPVVEKKASEDAAAVLATPPPLDGPQSASLKDITAQKATMTAEEAAAALLAAQKAAEPPPVITPETLAQDWWRTLSFDTKFLYAMTLRKKAANQLVKAVERAETIQKIVGDPNTAAPATLVYAHFQAHAIQHPTFQRLNNPEAYTFAMWWFCLGFATILIGTHPIPLVAQYDIITQFCNLLYSGGIVCIGMLFGYAEGFRKLDVAVACLIGITTGMVCDFGSDSVITSAIVIAILGIGNGYPRAQVPLLPEFFSHRPPQYMQPAVLMPQGSQPHLMTQGSQPQLVTQGSHPQLIPQGSQPQLVRPATPVAVVGGAAAAAAPAAAATPAAPAPAPAAGAAPLVPQGSQAQLAPQYYIPMPPPDQKVFKLNVTAEQVLAVIKYSMQEAWAGRSTDGVLHYCNRGVAFGSGLLIGVFLMSGLYDMHSLVYCALMAASSAAAPVIMGRKQKIA